MRNGCVKKMLGSTSDRISDLPSHVIEKFLTCMPTKEAVRTSVLSKKWRYNWVTIPELEFNDAYFWKPITTTRKSRTSSRKSRTTSTNEFVLTVCQVLSLHRGPILKFKLLLTELENCAAVDQSIPFVSKNGVRDLILIFNLRFYEHYKLPSSLFSCAQLEHLELHHCLFVLPPRFTGFSKLHSLELHDVIITSEAFSGLISNWPLLKELEIVNPVSLSYLEITAPNLRYLYYEGDSWNIWFKNAPSLANVSIRVLYSVEVNLSKWVTVFAGLPAIEYLVLDYYCLEFIPQSDIPRRLPDNLNRLKILVLFVTLDSVSVVSSILCIIRSSPNLKKIYIYDYESHDSIMRTLDHVEEQGCLDMSSNRLREVQLHMECNQGFQLEIVKYLLATSPILKKMVIRSIYALDHGRLKFWKAVTQFRRLCHLWQKFSLNSEKMDYVPVDQPWLLLGGC